jgi:hypothetical protein
MEYYTTKCVNTAYSASLKNIIGLQTLFCDYLNDREIWYNGFHNCLTKLSKQDDHIISLGVYRIPKTTHNKNIVEKYTRREQ